LFGKTAEDTYGARLEAIFATYQDQVRLGVNEEENVRRLLGGSIDGFLVEVYVGAAVASRLGSADAVEYHPLNFDAGTYRLQMSRQTVSAERLGAFNAAIQELAFNGWLADQMKYYDIQGKDPKH
jgi:ABC-type amino acid transport substrate-binding protein